MMLQRKVTSRDQYSKETHCAKGKNSKKKQ